MAGGQTRILEAVANAIEDVGRDPTVPRLDPVDAVQVRNRVIEKIEPIIENVTNNEPLWRSKVMIGSVAAIVAAAFGIFDLATEGSRDASAYAFQITTMVGAGIAIYGRLAATAAIGR